MSCHMTAEVPTLSPLSPLFQANPPSPGSTAWMRWFANGPCGVPFDQGAKSADYSLQLAMGIANFEEWASPAQSGLFAADYETPPVAAAAENAAPRLKAAKPAKRKVFPIIRDVVTPNTEK